MRWPATTQPLSPPPRCLVAQRGAPVTRTRHLLPPPHAGISPCTEAADALAVGPTPSSRRAVRRLPERVGDGRSGGEKAGSANGRAGPAPPLLRRATRPRTPCAIPPRRMRPSSAKLPRRHLPRQPSGFRRPAQATTREGRKAAGPRGGGAREPPVALRERYGRKITASVLKQAPLGLSLCAEP
jgi:hypothetical protein